MAVFHSVSAFCNAGFALFNNNLMNYTGSYLLNFTICALIVLGGIGFPVVFEIYNLAVKKRGKRVKDIGSDKIRSHNHYYSYCFRHSPFPFTGAEQLS